MWLLFFPCIILEYSGFSTLLSLHQHTYLELHTLNIPSPLPPSPLITQTEHNFTTKRSRAGRTLMIDASVVGVVNEENFRVAVVAECLCYFY